MAIPDLTPVHGAAVFLAGLAAGGINAVVGSGSLITFPTLVALGYPPVLANVSNNIGLVPGSITGVWGYRRELTGQRHRLVRLIPASAIGGSLGAVLLLVAPPGVFKRIVPLLIVLALVLVVVGPRLSKALATHRPHDDGVAMRPALVPLVALTGVYGGYFGAAQGILLISLLTIFVADDLQRLNGVKNVLAGTVNAVASIVFLARAEIEWPVVGLIAAGSTIGGHLGASVGRKLPANALRAFIVVVGVAAIVRLLA